MSANLLFLYLVQRIIFPIIFGFCIISRPAVLSIPYLVFLLYAPFLPFTTRKLAHKRTKCFLMCVLAISAIITLIQIGIQLMLYVKGIELVSDMEPLGDFLQGIGLTELYMSHSQTICWCFVTDVFLCMSCIVTLVLLNKISAVERSDNIGDSIIIDNIFGRSKYLKAKSHVIVEGIAIFLVLSTLLLAAILKPSIASAVYFWAFLLLVTFWGLNQQMYYGFVFTCRIVCAVLIVHIGAMFAFQASFAVENNVFHKHRQNSTIMQLLGLKSHFKLVDNNFVSIVQLAEIDAFLNPVALILCYYMSAIYLRDIKGRQKAERKNSTAIQLEPIEVAGEQFGVKKENSATKIFIKRVYGFVCRHSNIVSNVMMMLWSIVFRSWLSFVFLLIVIILWTRSTQRKRVHHFNLFIVFYADLLMVLQYICCVIPIKEPDEHNKGHLIEFLAEIGIIRYTDIFPCIPLLFQAICTLTFCFTLRQGKFHTEEQRRASARSLQSFPMHPEKKATIWKCFDFGINVLTHLWVLLILLTMFIYGIWGKEVNLMKLCYLVYVLVFITTYQLSLYVWRNITYALWMLVIVSANLNLILIYVYQFERVENFLMNYMGIDRHMQIIIGLRRYDSNLQLLIQLFYFTFLVVITAIQLLIFQNKYTKQFMWKTTELPVGKVQEKKSSDEQHTTDDPSATKKSFMEKIIQGISSFIDVNKTAMAWICRLLELQFFKVVLILGFFMSTSEISFFNLLLFVLVIFACVFENYTDKLSCGIISLGASTVVILKVLFQLFKIPENLDWLCFSDNTQSLTSRALCDVNNTAKWIGVQKLNSHENLIQIFGPYLTFLAAAAIFTSVAYYQMRKRFLNGETSVRSRVLFENVTREDADKSVTLLIKYLFNYGFYKFGIEITLIVLVMLISLRRDVVSAVYVIWLCTLFRARRKSKQFLWPMFMYFVTLSNLVQYATLLNLPLFLEMNFEWEFDQIERLSEWLTLKNQPSKLLLDFLLLMCICRQQNVFRIERKYGGRKYLGGRNESTVKDVSTILSGQLPIRTHDFMYPTKWIDIVKCVVYCSSFWVTLSIVFLTGTISLNAYSFGYLISSFLFCYIGTNFYMKPFNTILEWWKTLIAYNVFVIVTKSMYNLWIMLHEKHHEIGEASSQHPDETIHSLLNENKSSTVLFDQLDVGYDCICFAFLIFQLRIFKSFDFIHIINESNATFVCDSRGTKLLDARMYEMHSIQEQREQQTLEKIKLKVKRIKANQQKFEPNLIPSRCHQEAVRYNGKSLYEELVEKTEFQPRHNEPNVESEESFLLKSHNSTLQATNALATEDQPSTSKHNGDSIIQSEAKADGTKVEGVKRNHFKTIMRDLLISITLYLYKFSRNYRFVHEILTKEKKQLKLKSCGSEGGSGEEKIYFFSRQHSVVAEFCQASWFAIIANTDVICYLFIFLNTILTMNNWTLPISLGVCLWALLSIQRPSKQFWLILIAYTEVFVFVQYLMRIISHFHTFEMHKSNATINLILLHLMLFHRSVQKQMGVWTKKINDNVVYAYDFLNTRSLNATIRCNSIIQIPADVYTFMFLCDLFNFFVLMFGFSAFTQSPYDSGVYNYVKENQIPFRFFLVLLVQFVSIIIDRALYLQRNMKGKIVFYLFSVIAVHMWLFHFIHQYNEKPLHAVTWPPKLFYFVKCLYFLFSAYQIRCGYPKTVSGNFASNGTSLAHWRVFQYYKMIPFLSEARTLLDWLCIKTSLSLYEWFKMEDIYSELFVIKCRRQYEKSAPRPRGTIRGSKGDYMRAMFSLMVFFVLIWGPWGLFTFDNSFGKSNVPYEVTVTLYAGSSQQYRLYRKTTQGRTIHQFNETDFDLLKTIYKNHTSVQTFVSNYDERDIAAISMNVNSTTLFMVSPPSLQEFRNELNENGTIKFRYSISVSRLSHDEPNAIELSRTFEWNANNSARQEMIKILSDGNREQRVHLPLLIPKFLKVMNAKGLHAMPKFLPSGKFRNIILRLNEMEGKQWWELAEDCNDGFYEETLSKLPYADCRENSVIYTFNDKLFPSSISGVIKSGILGLYSMYILLTWKFFRTCMATKISDIALKDLPYVDRILQLCSDIYLVREQCDFKLEEDLYAKLIFLYRSPETMISWTRMPEQEIAADDQTEIDESNAEKALRKSLNHRII